MRLDYQILLKSPPPQPHWLDPDPPLCQNGHLSILEIETKYQNFLENLPSATQFRLIDLFLAMTVYSPQ